MSQTAQTSSDRPTQHFSAKRIAIYLLGLLILTTGLTLNTKVTLGVSPILSVAYCVSEAPGMNFGDVTFFWFCIFVLVQVVLHLIRRGPNLKTQFIADCS